MYSKEFWVTVSGVRFTAGETGWNYKAALCYREAVRGDVGAHVHLDIASIASCSSGTSFTQSGFHLNCL